MTHDEHINNFLRAHPAWQRVGLRKAVNTILERDDVQPLPLLRFVPDAFCVQPNLVELLEVEKHSHIGHDKLQKLVDFWSEMDARSWSVRLITIQSFTGAVSYVEDLDFQRLFWDIAYALD